jgi:hypothetical protein
VYKVGDSAGWTASGNIDYKQWSATKTFQVGDVIRKLIPLPFLPHQSLLFMAAFGLSIRLYIS